MGDACEMEFIGSAVNAVILVAVLVWAKDWLIGLRAEIQETRESVAQLGVALSNLASAIDSVGEGVAVTAKVAIATSSAVTDAIKTARGQAS